MTSTRNGICRLERQTPLPKCKATVMSLSYLGHKFQRLEGYAHLKHFQFRFDEIDQKNPKNAQGISTCKP
jgi:hypothetical protein